MLINSALNAKAIVITNI